MPDVLYIPFSRELYNDLVRHSQGRVDPAELAEDRVRCWLDLGLQMTGNQWGPDDDFLEAFGERPLELARKYAPGVVEAWEEQEDAEIARRTAARKPLVWKDISVPAGSQVRMSYGGQHYYATVTNGKIVDEDGEFSPSEWAYKVANRTSRNAWRDLWFKEPGSSAWVPAQMLRERNREARSKFALSLMA